MSAKTATKKPRSHHYSFLLPDGEYVGRRSFHDSLGPTSVEYATWYSVEGIRAKRHEILTLFPAAKIVPTPRFNEESEEWETPVNVPSLN